MKKSEELVVVEQEFNCALSELWNALVEPDLMRQWFFGEIAEFRPEVGFTTEFLVDAGERKFLHQWQVTEVIPQQRIAYRWRYAGYDGAAISVFEIEGDDKSCRLKASFPLEEDFSDDVPEFSREACLGGWDYFINQQLKNFLEK